MVDTCVIDACMHVMDISGLSNDVYLANDVYFTVILVIACIFYVYAMNSGVYTVKFEFFYFFSC
jgi:hypothetical protein